MLAVRLRWPPMILIAPMVLVALLQPSFADVFHIAPGGNDENNGSPTNPWQTLQMAADSVAPGDSVIVLPNTYAGFDLQTSGNGGAPIMFPCFGTSVYLSLRIARPDGVSLSGKEPLFCGHVYT